MPVDSNVGVFPDGAGKKIDTESLVSGVNTVQRQRIRIGGELLGDLANVKDGKLEVGVNPPGNEADAASDSGPSGDGLIDLTTGPDQLVAISVSPGTTYSITGWTWLADRLCIFTLEVADTGTLVETIRLMSNSSTQPGDTMYFPVPIKVTGASGREIRVKAKRLNGTAGAAFGAINGFTS